MVCGTIGPCPKLDVQLLKAFHSCFRGNDEKVNYVDFEVEHQRAATMRKTRIR
jgi:hypothetical protein